MLNKGILHNVKNPQLTARVNSYCGEPTQWFSTKDFYKKQLYWLNVDFFVNWKDKIIVPELWNKRIISGNFNSDPAQIFDQILQSDGMEYITHLLQFANNYHFTVVYILSRNIDVNAWNDPGNKVYLFNLSNYVNLSRTNVVDVLSADELKVRIRQLRKLTYNIGKKSLKYATTSLEAYLSLDDAIYPGDADIILIDENANAVAVLEVKKHNPASQRRAMKVSNETISLYQSTDVLKYNSLGLLKDFLNCPLYMLYYTTVQEESRDPDSLKFEQLVGPYNSLKAVYPKLMPLPYLHDPNSLAKFCNTFINYIHVECKYDFDHICLTSSHAKGTPISLAPEYALKYTIHPRNTSPEKAAVRQYLKFLTEI